MLKVLKRWPVMLLLISILGFSVALYLYNKPHKNIAKAKVAYTVSSSDLFHEFETNSHAAIKKYKGKVLEITGPVQTVDVKDTYATVILANEGDFYGINCSFGPKNLKGLPDIVVGELVTIKGECKGFIDDVILSNCIQMKK